MRALKGELQSLMTNSERLKAQIHFLCARCTHSEALQKIALPALNSVWNNAYRTYSELRALSESMKATSAHISRAADIAAKDRADKTAKDTGDQNTATEVDQSRVISVICDTYATDRDEELKYAKDATEQSKIV